MDDVVSNEVIYCIDSNVLIDLSRSLPPTLVPDLWRRLEELIAAGRLIAPPEVFEELSLRSDAIGEWAKANRSLFGPLTQELVDECRGVVQDLEWIVDTTRPRPHDADPWIVALALLEKKRGRECVVVTNESRVRGYRIPDACAFYDIESVDWVGFFEKEGWRIEITQEPQP